MFVCLERKEIRERMMMGWRSVKTWNRDENKQNESQNRDEEVINEVNKSILSIYSLHSSIDPLIHSLIHSHFKQTIIK